MSIWPTLGQHTHTHARTHTRRKTIPSKDHAALLLYRFRSLYHPGQLCPLSMEKLTSPQPIAVSVARPSSCRRGSRLATLSIIPQQKSTTAPLVFLTNTLGNLGNEAELYPHLRQPRYWQDSRRWDWTASRSHWPGSSRRCALATSVRSPAHIPTCPHLGDARWPNKEIDFVG